VLNTFAALAVKDVAIKKHRTRIFFAKKQISIAADTVDNLRALANWESTAKDFS
jgi:hypothetical protein